MTAHAPIDAVKAYHAAGYHPIPIEPRGKRPLVRWQEYASRQPTVEELERWWTATPDANVALIMGRGVFAIDIDGPAGEDALARSGVVIPETCPISATGRGRHVFFGGQAPTAVGVLPHVDIRSDGSYVLVSPSIHPTGTPYRWIRALTPTLPAPPDALRRLFDRPPGRIVTPTGSSTWLLQALNGVPQGERDTMCTRLAGYLWRKGLPEDAVEKILQLWARQCVPPFPPDAVAKCVRSIVKRDGGPVMPEGLPPTAHAVLPATLQSLSASRVVLPTGLETLDASLDGGLEPATVTLLAGAPGAGKTACALQIARTIAERGVGVLFLTLEMTPMRLMRRVLAQASGVPFRRIKAGDLVDEERMVLTLASTRLERLPLWIETRAHSVERLDDVLDRFLPGDIGLVIIDYLQRLRGPHGHDRYVEVSHVSRALTALAQARGVPILAISSLNRFGNERPTLRNLRDSGQLEYDSDTVLILYREDGAGDTVEVHIAKQREGISGITKRLRWRGDILTFEDPR